jgi:cysteine-rich repeat protein
MIRFVPGEGMITNARGAVPHAFWDSALDFAEESVEAAGSIALAMAKELADPGEAYADVANAIISGEMDFSPVGLDGSNDTVTLDLSGSLFSTSAPSAWPTPVFGKVQASISGSGSYHVKSSFTPGIQLSGKLSEDTGTASSFTLDIDSRLTNSITFTLDATTTIESAGGKKGQVLGQLLAEGGQFAQEVYSANVALADVENIPVGGWAKTLWISSPQMTTIAAGPVIVVLTFTAQVDIECGFQAQALFKGSQTWENTSTFTTTLTTDLSTGAISFYKEPAFSGKDSRHGDVSSSGSVVVACGVIPRFNVFAYDTVGVSLGVRGSLAVTGTGTSVCPNKALDSTPDMDVTAKLDASAGLQVGLRIQTPGSSYLGLEGEKLGVDLGPIEVWNDLWPLAELEWNFPGKGLGYCTPTCENKKQDTSSDGSKETDVDCGGGVCGQCAEGSKCTKSSDCEGGVNCNKNTKLCGVSLCEDGARDGTESDIDCGGAKCAPCADGKKCSAATDCASTFCGPDTTKCAGKPPKDKPKCESTIASICFSDHCKDHVKDADEGATDCGGATCKKCLVGDPAKKGSDCISGFSNGVACVKSHCEDAVKDKDESDVDCGGSLCARCGNQQACKVNGDCFAGLVCPPSTLRCAKPTCSDGLKDQGETDVDCGGPVCKSTCATGQKCSSNTDCVSKGCYDVTKTCAVSQCVDDKKDGAETDIDCGGGTCSGCLVGKSCGLASDCATNACNAVSKKCVASQCADSQKNGAETDVDCGGGTCGGCAVGKSCGVSSDCSTNACDAISKTCVANQCADNQKDGAETDVDCGGATCGKCALGKTCGVISDCSTNACDAIGKTCVANQCADNQKDGAETDVDCGGATCGKCALGKTCAAGADCVTATCDPLTKLCVPAPFCGDGVKNGGDACDAADLGGATCLSVLGPNHGGSLGCTAACAFDTSACTLLPFCGDGVKNGGDACDAADLGGATCLSVLGPNHGGSLGCTAGCAFDTSACTLLPFCGDGVKNGGDACDAADLGGATCLSVLGPNHGGSLGCTAGCAFDTSACTLLPFCGDGVKNGGDACDAADLGGATCLSVLGPNHGGSLGCTAGCAFDTSACTLLPFCGDGVKNGGDACDAADLGGATCLSVLGPNHGGSLGCTAGCAFDTSACTLLPFCGDGVKNGGDSCDGADFGGETCLSFLGPNHGGSIACAGDCSFDISGCFDVFVCGDGSVGGAETCDDGATVNGDGCSASCVLEAGWSCVGAPSLCSTMCGDGVVAGAEPCDDANAVNGDGCSMGCTVEPGYVCAGSPSICGAPMCNGTVGLPGPSPVVVANGPIAIVSADVNADGTVDLVVASNSNNNVNVAIGLGAGKFAAPVNYPAGTGPSAVRAADLNGDGKSDIIVTNQVANTMSVLINNGNGTFAAKVDYVTGTTPGSIAAADVNGDSIRDLVIGNKSSNTVSVFINNGNGTFAAKVDYATSRPGI